MVHPVVQAVRFWAGLSLQDALIPLYKVAVVLWDILVLHLKLGVVELNVFLCLYIDEALVHLEVWICVSQLGLPPVLV